ncbi:MAG: tRNA (guanosine(37)-N1)-methyltransferase TrmD [Candidatus Saccharibacteria bacterium]|nr:tRNA (guanosine(37)-N1)-methyltransferase TrmD [Candidatus Saccharibacteria bacterium]
MRQISIVSLFPQAIESYLRIGMLAKAQLAGIVQFNVIDLRQFGLGKRRQVDDTPYGGGGGMILRVEPLVAVLEFIKQKTVNPTKVILLTPRGKLFKQAKAFDLAQSDSDLILIGGRYEGYDERIVAWVDEQISIGQYILTGSELPSLLVVDSVVRLLDGVLASPSSIENESFVTSDNQIEYPQYTKPEIFRDLSVPPVLLTGHHSQIEAWRKQQTRKF